MPEWWDQLWSDPEKLKRLGEQFGQAGAGALTGGMGGRGWRGSLAGFLGGFEKGGKSYDEAQLNQAQAKLAGTKARMPAWTHLPPGYVEWATKRGIDVSTIPDADILRGAAPGMAPPGGTAPPGAPGAAPPPGAPPGPPGGPPGGGSGDPQIERFRAVAAAGKVPRDQIIAEMRRLGLNPALLGGYGDRGTSAF